MGSAQLVDAHARRPAAVGSDEGDGHGNEELKLCETKIPLSGNRRRATPAAMDA